MSIMKKNYIKPNSLAIDLVVEDSMMLTASGKQELPEGGHDDVILESNKGGWSSEDWSDAE